MFDVICAGQAVIDCITTGKENEPYKPNVYRAETIRLHTGGDAVNESMVLAKLGRKTALVCGLGNDPAGDIIIDTARACGVDVSGVKRIPGMDTPIANIQVSKDGSRSSVNSRATLLPGFSVDPNGLKGARIVSFASLFRAPFDTADKIIPLIKAAKKGGATICADTKLPLTSGSGSTGRTNPLPEIIDSLKEVLPLIDYIFPNENEAAYYSGVMPSVKGPCKTYDEMGRILLSLGIKNVIIKAGSAGCYVYSRESSCNTDTAPGLLIKNHFHIPAQKVENIVDTTGAGDNFVAGFISALLDNASLKESAEAGIRSAARSLTHTGAVAFF